MPKMPDAFTIAEHTGSILPHCTYVQELDEERVRDFLASGYEGKYDEEWTERIQCKYTSVRDHVAAIAEKLNGGELRTRLSKPSKAKVDNARVYHTGLVTVSELSGDVRDFFCVDNYDDFDIINCQPTLLLQDAERGGMPLDGVERYVNDRPAVFDELIAATGCTKAQAKGYVIRRLFGGSSEGWVMDAQKEHDKDETVPVPNIEALKKMKWVRDFENDITNLTKMLKKRNKSLWETISNSVRRDNKRNGTHKKPEARLLALYAQGLERRVLDEVFSSVPAETRERMVYSYDGFLIPKRFKMSVENLEDITNETNPRVKWSVKPMTRHLDTVAPFVAQNKDKAPDPLKETPPTQKQLETLDIHYMNDLPTYKSQLKYFNRFVMKVRNGDYWICQREYNQYANRGEGAYYRKQYTMDWSRLSHAYGEVRTGKVWNDKKQAYIDPPAASTTFLSKYRGDINKRAVMDITFHPEPVPFTEVTQSSDRYNTFLGYPEHLFDADVNHEEAKYQKALSVWQDILRNLVAGDGSGGRLDDAEAEDNYRGVLNFFACTVMEPAKRLEHALVCQGSQGNGKGTIIDSVGALVGSEHYISTSNIADLLGDHAEGFLNRVLVNLDESDAADQKGKQGQMKTMVTMKEQSVNPKHLRPYKIDVFASLVLSTNKKNGVTIDLPTGERRFIVVCGTEKFVKAPAAFWTKLHETFQEQGFQKLLFEFLRHVHQTDARTFDFKAFKERNSRRGPYRALALRYTPELAFYLQDLVESQRFVHVGRKATDTGEETESLKSADFATLTPVNFDQQNRAVNFWEDDRYETPMLFSGDAMLRDFKHWSKDNHFSFTETTNHKQFYNMFSNNNIPMRRVDKSNRVYLSFTPRELYTALSDKKFIDVDPQSPAVKTPEKDAFVDEWGLMDE